MYSTHSDKSIKDRQNNNVKMVLKSIFWCFLFSVLLHHVQDANGSVLTVQNGVYKRLTVKVSEAVPRQLCHRAINNLQVRSSFTRTKCI